MHWHIQPFDVTAAIIHAAQMSKLSYLSKAFEPWTHSKATINMDTMEVLKSKSTNCKEKLYGKF